MVDYILYVLSIRFPIVRINLHRNFISIFPKCSLITRAESSHSKNQPLYTSVHIYVRRWGMYQREKRNVLWKSVSANDAVDDAKTVSVSSPRRSSSTSSSSKHLHPTFNTTRVLQRKRIHPACVSTATFSGIEVETAEETRIRIGRGYRLGYVRHRELRGLPINGLRVSDACSGRV